MARLVSFDALFDDNGENHALIVESHAKSPHPRYPIYLSGQIVSNARVYMSSIYRACNAYHEPGRAIYYTDTDSLVLSRAAACELSHHGYIGTDLGQLGCDLYDAFSGEFSKIIRGVWAAPKGYLFIHTSCYITWKYHQ